jgi:hypothetical protein
VTSTFADPTVGPPPIWTRANRLRACCATSAPARTGCPSALTTLPPLQWLFDTTLPPIWALLLLLPMPVVVWGVDEAYRAWRARRDDRRGEWAAP